MRIVRALATVAIATGASVGVALATPLSAHAAGTAMVSILHAVPNTPVDVCANGKALLTNFQPGTLTDPQSLPAGSYDLKITAANSGCGAAAVLEAKGVNVPAGANITVVAHLDAGGAPKLTPYVNDVSAVPAGKARLTVRHDAAAPMPNGSPRQPTIKPHPTASHGPRPHEIMAAMRGSSPMPVVLHPNRRASRSGRRRACTRSSRSRNRAR